MALDIGWYRDYAFLKELSSGKKPEYLIITDSAKGIKITHDVRALVRGVTDGLISVRLTRKGRQVFKTIAQAYAFDKQKLMDSMVYVRSQPHAEGFTHTFDHQFRTFDLSIQSKLPKVEKDYDGDECRFEAAVLSGFQFKPKSMLAGKKEEIESFIVSKFLEVWKKLPRKEWPKYTVQDLMQRLSVSSNGDTRRFLADLIEMYQQEESK